VSADASAGAPLQLAPWPQPDFAAFGPVETVALPRIQKVVSSTLARNWVMIPHVTHHDNADISGLDQVRRELAQRAGRKLTPLPFLIKAAAAALKELPRFNASLGADGASLVLKKYFHIGFAVDTPNGLVVPVLLDVDRKSPLELAAEIEDLTLRARSKGLPASAMQGGCFTVSSLGSVGGTGFTPIINAPELAILGAARSFEAPLRTEGGLSWRTMLPLSLSYDHRVINGADAARFCLAVGKELGALSQAPRCPFGFGA
jgi:pyruvate dehydrogenase E2 component (dihydrolipoamide acetyltransferase)